MMKEKLINDQSKSLDHKNLSLLIFTQDKSWITKKFTPINVQPIYDPITYLIEVEALKKIEHSKMLPQILHPTPL